MKQKRSTYRSLTTKLITKIESIILDENAKLEDLEELFDEFSFKGFPIKRPR